MPLIITLIFTEIMTFIIFSFIIKLLIDKIHELDKEIEIRDFKIIKFYEKNAFNNYTYIYRNLEDSNKSTCFIITKAQKTLLDNFKEEKDNEIRDYINKVEGENKDV